MRPITLLLVGLTSATAWAQGISTPAAGQTVVVKAPASTLEWLKDGGLPKLEKESGPRPTPIWTPGTFVSPCSKDAMCTPSVGGPTTPPRPTPPPPPPAPCGPTKACGPGVGSVGGLLPKTEWVVVDTLLHHSPDAGTLILSAGRGRARPASAAPKKGS